MTGTARIRLRQGLTIRPLPDGDAVVAADEGETAVIVNASAHAILDLLEDGRTEQEIADFMCRSFPATEAASVRRDVAALVAELLRVGIVEPCGAASSTA